MPNPVVHFEIVTGDPDGQIDFLRHAFDWNMTRKSPAPA
jgi:predicted enzyme related to lactoylglutathione lyase